MSKRAVLYARVSTDEQADKGYSLPTQLEACRKYVETHGHIVVAEMQDDCSGAKLDRPGLDRVREMIERKEADAVIVFTSDRLSRNLAHSLILREGWQRAGVELHYVNRGKSEDTPESRMTENFEGVFNEYWREKIIEACKRGKLAKARAGKWVGISLPYGFQREGKGREARPTIDECESAIVRRIFDEYVGKAGYKRIPILGIAEHLTAEGVPSPMRGGHTSSRGWWYETVRKILTNRTYIGEFAYAGCVASLPELAIIDRETFDAAQKQIERNKEQSKRNRRHEYLLTSYFRCVCGLAITGITRSEANRHYRCKQVSGNQHLRTCHEVSVRVSEADKKVWGWIVGVLSDDEKLDKGLCEMAALRESELEPKRERLATIDGLIARTEGKIRRLVSIIADTDDDTSLDALRAELRAAGKQKDALTTEREILAAELAQGEITEIDRARIKEIAALIRARLGDEPTYEQKRELFELLNLQVLLQRKDDKRWLFAKCGLRPDGNTLPIETTHSVRPCLNLHSVIIFSAILPLDEPNVKHYRIRESRF